MASSSTNGERQWRDALASLRRDASPIVADTLEELRRQQPGVVTRFLDWYEQLEPSAFDERTLSDWVQRGVPRVREVLTALDGAVASTWRAIDEALARVVAMRAVDPRPTSTRAAEATDALYRRVASLRALMWRFAGCDESLGAWFLGLARRWLRNATLRRAVVDELESRCDMLRVERLRA